MRRILREIKYFLWMLNGFIGLKFRLSTHRRVTILITYYSPVRMKHINHQIRNIFKCDFVGKVIISNHNPNIKIDSLIKVKSDHLTVVNQDIRRGCGHRWLVANQYSPEYLIVMDDDILIFPWQLKKLFEALVAEPQIPHGFAGMIHHKDGFLEYREKEERYLDYICEIYAITGEHLQRFMELRDEVLRDKSLTNMVEFAADFMIVSRSGNGNPKIHNAGKLFRCPTYNEAGVAVHKNHDFDDSILGVAQALNNYSSVPDRQKAVFAPAGGNYGSK